MKKSVKFSPEVRERSVRMVLEHQGEYESQWAAICSIAAKVGCTHETLRRWVRESETGLQGSQELLPLTVPEVQRLLLALVWPRWPAPEHSLAWSYWRRHHQACANACHRQRALLQQLQL
jgi:transposase-like protein